MGQTSPNIQNFASARGAAYKVYSIIDNVRKAAFFSHSAHIQRKFHRSAAGQLSVCITAHTRLYFGTLESGFDAADNLGSVMIQWILL